MSLESFGILEVFAGFFTGCVEERRKLILKNSTDQTLSFVFGWH
jgi:hypothetical protein